MANEQVALTLDAVHEAIVHAIRAQFPGLRTVEAYRLDRRSVNAPACLIELAELEALTDRDPGTGELAVQARFEARFVIGFRQGVNNPKMEIRKLAAAFAVFARLNRWGVRGIGPAQVIGCYPDDFDPEMDQYECWRVDWAQELRLGESVWADDGTPVPGVWTSWAPDIGAAHEADYQRVARAQDE